MKNKVLSCSLIVASLFLLCAVSSWAKGDADVAKTIHNMSVSAPYIYYRSTETQICIFCHTPHGGVLNGPLWNRSMATSAWSHYNSASLSSAIVGDDRAVSDESMLCMACHDGSISVFHLINQSALGMPKLKDWGTGSSDVPIMPMPGGLPGAMIGGSEAKPGGFGDLSDDHPISFSYTAVLAGGGYGAGQAKDGQLRPVDQAEIYLGEGVRFFGGDKRVECSSCHDPHVDYETDQRYRPFLIRPNDGSKLCLACHNK